MKHCPNPWRSAVITVIVVTHLASLGPGVAFAQGAPAAAAPSSVQRGQDYYEQARFDEAIAVLREAVDHGQLSADDLQKAREYLARSYAKKGDVAQAKDTFKAILKDNPAWRPDAIRVPPDETAVFDQALKEYQAESAAAPPPPPAKKPAKPAKPAKQPKPKPEPTPAASLTEGGGKKSHKVLWLVLGGAAVAGIAVAAGGGKSTGGKPAPQALAGFPATP